ncbi:Serine--tRNA ligase [Bienertia sinuspersici]
MANNSFSHFMPDMWFDHCPVVVHFEARTNVNARTFKFFDMWCSHPTYKDIIDQGWKLEVKGCKMFQVVQKLKEIKRHLKKLNREAYSEISVRYHEAKKVLREIQEESQAQTSTELSLKFGQILKIPSCF